MPDKTVVGVIKALIRYSFHDIESFEDLTEEEREIIELPIMFEFLKFWAK